MDTWNGPHDARWDAAQAALAESGITDGLPVVPRHASVSIRCCGCRGKVSQPLATLPPRTRKSHGRCGNQRGDGSCAPQYLLSSGQRCGRWPPMNSTCSASPNDGFGNRVHHRERADLARNRHEQRRECIRPWQSRERDDRPRSASYTAERRRCACGRNRHGDARPAREIYVRIRGERSRVAVAAAARRARLRSRGRRGHRRRHFRNDRGRRFGKQTAEDPRRRSAVNAISGHVRQRRCRRRERDLIRRDRRVARAVAARRKESAYTSARCLRSTASRPLTGARRERRAEGRLPAVAASTTTSFVLRARGPG